MLRVLGSGFRVVEGFGFWIQDLSCRVKELRLGLSTWEFGAQAPPLPLL